MGYSKRGNPFKLAGSWAFNYYVEDSAGNKRRRQKSGYATKKEADLARRQKEADVLTRTYLVNEKLKCRDFFVDWLENEKKPQITANTYYTFRNAVNNYIIPEIGNRRVCDLNRTILKKLYEHSYNRYPKVARIVKTVVNVALDYAYEENYIRVNPAIGLLLPSLPQARKELITLSVEQIQQLIIASYDTRIYMEVLLSVSLGLRKAELAGLKYSDIDYTQKTIHVRRALGRVLVDLEKDEPQKWGNLTKEEKTLKTQNSNRIIRLSSFVLEALQKHRERYEANREIYGNKFRDDDFICCSVKGQPRCTSYFYVPFKELLIKAALPDIRWHDLRHASASFLLNSEINLRAVSDFLGHSSQDFTGDKYIDSKPSEVCAMKGMNRFIDELIKNAKTLSKYTSESKSERQRLHLSSTSKAVSQPVPKLKNVNPIAAKKTPA